jgi:curved DNA-binding protein
VSVKFQDYYATLGVDRSATREQIQSAYRKLARKHHPDVDKTPGATQRFAQIGEAYEVLKNEKTRKRYDALGARWKEGEEFTPPPGWENARSARGGDREGFQTFEFDGGDGFSSFFEALFGNAAGPAGFRGARRRGAERGPRIGQSIEGTVEIELEDAYSGATKTLTLDDGQGGARTYEVKIPAGTTDGGTIRLRGQGSPGVGGGPPGDLLLHIAIRPHVRFDLSGHDLATVLAIAPWEAALGAKIGLRIPDASEVTLTVPPGSSSGKKLRMRGLGMPRGHGERGDLIVELRILVPETLSDAERRAFEELARASRFDPRKS